MALSLPSPHGGPLVLEFERLIGRLRLGSSYEECRLWTCEVDLYTSACSFKYPTRGYHMSLRWKDLFSVMHRLDAESLPLGDDP